MTCARIFLVAFFRSTFSLVVIINTLLITKNLASAQFDGPGGSTSAAAIEQRAITQLGLAHGFLSRVLQSEVQILKTIQGRRVGACASFIDGGSIKLLKAAGFIPINAEVNIYYDAQCKTAFLKATLTVYPSSKTNVSFNETAMVYRSTGPLLGKLAINGTADDNGTTTLSTGTGTFVPANTAYHIHVGLNCAYPSNLRGAKPFGCKFAVAQPFKELRLDVATLSSLTYTVRETTTNSFTGSFSGGASLATGPFGTLSVSVPTTKSLVITGGSKVFGHSTITGSERLAVFSPPPTSWTAIDTAAAKAFSLSMARDATGNSSGGVKDTTTKKSISTFLIDQSGTGSAIYADGQKRPVTNWLIAD